MAEGKTSFTSIDPFSFMKNGEQGMMTLVEMQLYRILVLQI